eukprot:UN05249
MIIFVGCIIWNYFLLKRDDYYS